MAHTRAEIEAKIVDALENFGADPEKINRDATLEELDIDSLDLVELAQILDEEMDIQIEQGDLGEIRTVGDALDGIFEKAGAVE
ncbi:MAG: acyl carrier protein [Solirubrobacteraceae bacterium]|nr:acyl carrier protein [Solirubrobacteraceae bacterium]